MQAGTQLWANAPGRFDLTRTLPLHICDIVPWIGMAALWLPGRWTSSVAYFWGTALSVWALILPILNVGPSQLEFWLFWVGHGQIVATAAYLVGVSGFRPDWKDLRVVFVATAVYTVVAFLVNIWLQADYGYVGRASALRDLGPWPGRVLVLFGVEMVLFGLFLAPWLVLRKVRAREVGQSS